MKARDIIAYDIPAVGLHQTGKDAFHLLSDHHVKHLPVVSEGRLVGIISEEDIFNHKLYEPVNLYDFAMPRLHAVNANEHIFEVLRVMGENRLTVIPVIDDEGQYMGMVSQNLLLQALAGGGSFAMQGGLLVVEMDARQYSPAHITRIIEDENAKVTCAIITSPPDDERIELTLKINRKDLTRITAALERHDYHIKYALADDQEADGLRERYESLIHYLNI